MIYDIIENLPKYEEIKLMIEELARMKIDVKPQRDLLVKIKNRTELFGKSCEKLYSEKKLAFVNENNVIEYISNIVLLRNELILSDVLPGVIVNDFRCYEWTLNATILHKGLLCFLLEDENCSFVYKKYNKKGPFYHLLMNNFSLFTRIFQDGKSIEKLYPSNRFLNKHILKEMELNLESIDRIKKKTNELKLKKVQNKSTVDDALDNLQKDAGSMEFEKTFRLLSISLKEIELLMKEILQTKVWMYNEYNFLSELYEKANNLSQKIINLKKKSSEVFLKTKGRYQKDFDSIESLVKKVLILPVYIDGNEEFLLLLYILSFEFIERYKNFDKVTKNSKERYIFLKDLLTKYEKFPVVLLNYDIFQEALRIYEDFYSLEERNHKNFIGKSVEFIRKIQTNPQNSVIMLDLLAFCMELLMKSFENVSDSINKNSVKLEPLSLKIEENEAKPIDFEVLYCVVKEVIGLLGKITRKKRDFHQFFSIFSKMHNIFKEVSLEVKKTAYNLKNLDQKLEGQYVYHSVDFTKELTNVMSLNEHDFLLYFSTLDQIIDEKHLDQNKFPISPPEEDFFKEGNIDKYWGVYEKLFSEVKEVWEDADSENTSEISESMELESEKA